MLGSVAAERLGIEQVDQGQMISIGGDWFTVVGVLEPFPLAADLDRGAIIGKPVAESMFESELNPTAIYLRTDPEQIDDVRSVLGSTVDPQSPDEVSISRPSELLEAQDATDAAFTNLFLGLGAVSLLVGGVGIANVMVIAVIERRNEIGLRRALGGTRAHIRRQFLTEALMLSALGGLAGVLLGIAVTAAYAGSQGWAIVVPVEAMIGGFLSALIIGAVAGLYPAMRAARPGPNRSAEGGMSKTSKARPNMAKWGLVAVLAVVAIGAAIEFDPIALRTGSDADDEAVVAERETGRDHVG